jgi:anti-sigma-K factor RskA
MVGEDQDQMMVVANWDPKQRRLVLAVAGDMPADRGKSHELWVVPGDGTPRSLGVMPAGKKMHMELAEQIAELLRQGSTIAISVEPPGGSPTGSPTGPVMWSGKLERT